MKQSAHAHRATLVNSTIFFAVALTVAACLFQTWEAKKEQAKKKATYYVVR